MTRALLLLAALSACAPKDSTGAASTDDGGAGTSSGGASTFAPTTTGEATTGIVTTGDASTTMGPPVCTWYEPGNQDYCPLLAAPNIDILADTPMGPVAFKYAYFGMFLCDWCPDPGDPALGLFAQEQAPGLDPFVGDYVLFRGVNGKYLSFEGRIGDQPVDDGQGTMLEFPELMRATQEQTMPPLDPDIAPTMAGQISFVGNGWMLVGEFTASLCTTLNWNVFCE